MLVAGQVWKPPPLGQANPEWGIRSMAAHWFTSVPHAGVSGLCALNGAAVTPALARVPRYLEVADTLTKHVCLARWNVS